MRQTILHAALVVRDYDEAIEFFCGKLNFALVEDTYQPEQDKRWVVVAPPGSSGTSILLTGGRVFLFLGTDDFWRDFDAMTSTGIGVPRTRSISRNNLCSSTQTSETACPVEPARPVRPMRCT